MFGPTLGEIQSLKDEARFAPETGTWRNRSFSTPKAILERRNRPWYWHTQVTLRQPLHLLSTSIVRSLCDSMTQAMHAQAQRHLRQAT